MSKPISQPVHGIAIILMLFAAVFTVGCDHSAAKKKPLSGAAQGESGEHADHAGDEHSRPADFAAGVSQLKKHYLAIKKAFEQADIEKAVELAHDPLHAVGEILEALPDLAQEANLPPEDLQAVKKSVDALFEGYGSVDGAVHEGKEPDYKAVAAQIDEAMADLEVIDTPQGK